MSNDETLISVLFSWVFHNVHFRHFGVLKMRFLIIRQRVLLRHDFGYSCVGIWSTCKDHTFLTLIIAKNVIINNCIYIYMQSIQMILPQYCLCMSDFINTYCTDMLNVGFLSLYFARYAQTILWSVLRNTEINSN